LRPFEYEYRFAEYGYRFAEYEYRFAEYEYRFAEYEYRFAEYEYRFAEYEKFVLKQERIDDGIDQGRKVDDLLHPMTGSVISPPAAQSVPQPSSPT
jgi:hypothetical protein